jgi:hypothetical protein
MTKVSAAFLLLLTGSALANGGGYTTGVKFTGSVAPFQPEGAEQVQIVKENLDILLEAKSAAVSVRYEMKNAGTSAAKVRFGFPVEAYREETGLGPPGARTKKLVEQQVLKYCRNYSVTAGGKKVAAKFQTEPANEGKVPAFPGMEAFKGIGGWLVSEVKFPAGETTVVEIKFDSDYDKYDFGTDGSTERSADTFRYRLSTGGVWSGPIAEGTVRVRTSGVDASVVSLKAPANRFKPHADGGWVWSFRDLEPTLADDITILASEATSYNKDYTEGRDKVSEAYVQVGSKWFWHHRDFTVSASSALPGDKENAYDAAGVKNPSDYDENFRAWVEGKEDDGIGESLSLTPREAAPIREILVRPGFGKSKELFQANNRPKTLRITLNGSHTFVADLADKDVQQAIPVKDFKAAVKSVKIEIASVYRGSQYRDTAISDVLLVRPLSKEPKFQGAR